MDRRHRVILRCIGNMGSDAVPFLFFDTAISERLTVKNLIRKTAQWAVRSSAWKNTSKWIRGTERWNRLEDEYDGSYAKGEVVVYFGDRSSKFYQLEQWLPVLEELHKKHRVVLVLRKGSSLIQALESTHLPVVFKRRFDPLHTFY